MARPDDPDLSRSILIWQCAEAVKKRYWIAFISSVRIIVIPSFS